MDTVSRMPDNYLDCIITSPPYWQQRGYGYDGQWGLEPTYQEYLENLWSLMDAVYPKLKDEGTVWINLSDTYNGNKISNSNPLANEKLHKSNIVKKIQPCIRNKSLCLIPHRFAIGCIDRGWIVRNDIIWAKRNGMPESVKDRFSKKHEYMFFMVKNEKYYFDLDAIRDKPISDNVVRDKSKESFGIGTSTFSEGARNTNNPLGKNPGSVSDFWDIPTKPSSAKHYATYNDSLLVKPILAGCPEGGIIYDPFMGVGTTAVCALRAGRKFIGSEMSKEYCDIANKNIEPYLLQRKLF